MVDVPFRAPRREWERGPEGWRLEVPSSFL